MGWGIGATSPVTQSWPPTRRPWTDLVNLPAHDLLTSGKAVGLAGRTDGQFGGRSPQHRRRFHRPPVDHPDRQRHRDGELAGESGPHGAIDKTISSGGTLLIGGLCQRRWRPQPYPPPDSALRELPRSAGCTKRVAIDAFTDGRDTSPRAGWISSPTWKRISKIGVGRIATVAGGITPWTATTAGTARGEPTTPS